MQRRNLILTILEVLITIVAIGAIVLALINF